MNSADAGFSQMKEDHIQSQLSKDLTELLLEAEMETLSKIPFPFAKTNEKSDFSRLMQSS